MRQSPFKQLETLRPILFFIVAGTFTVATLAYIAGVMDGTFLKLTILYIGAAAICAFALRRLFRFGEARYSVSTPEVWYLIYVAACAPSLLWANSFPRSIDGMLWIVCLGIILSASRRTFGSESGRNFALRVIVAVGAVTMLIALLHFVLPADSSVGKLFRQIAGSSTLGNRTYYAGFLAMLLPIVVIELLRKHNSRGYKITLAAIIPTIIYLLVLTETRSAWVAVLLSVVLFLFLNVRKARIRWLLTTLLLVVVIGSSFTFPGIIQQRLASLFTSDPTSSVARRVVIYEGAWHAFVASPVIGRGIGNFVEFYPAYRSPDYWMSRSEDLVPHAHNEFLEILSETGLVGILAFLWLLFVCFRSIRRSYSAATADSKLLIAGLSCAIVAALIDNLGNVSLRTVPAAMMFWMILGLMMGLEPGASKEIRIRVPGILRRVNLLPVLVFLAFVAWSVPSMTDRYIAEKRFLEGIYSQYEKKFDKASTAFRDVLTRVPLHNEARAYLAANLIQAGEYRTADSVAQSLLADAVAYPKVRLLLAITAFESGDTAKTFRLIDEELTLNTSPQVYYYGARFSHDLHQPVRELFFVRTLLQQNVKSGNAAYATEAIGALEQLHYDGHVGRSECLDILLQVHDCFHADDRVQSASKLVISKLTSEGR